MRRDILDIVKITIENSGLFKKVYFGVAPPITAPKRLPAIAIVVENENRKRVQITGCQFQVELNVSLIIYHKGQANKYDDIISPLIEEVENLFKQNSVLDEKVIDYWVYRIEQDGGVLHPNYLANLSLKIIYRN